MSWFFKHKIIKYNYDLHVGDLVEHKINNKRMVVNELMDEDWLWCTIFNEIDGEFQDQAFEYRELIKL